jgi:uncharacterized protein YciI
MEAMAKWVFGAAGVYGLITLIPMYLLEPVIAAENPPALTHPEFFYGFLAVAISFQLLFLAIARRPVALRTAMVPAIAEKIGYAATALALVLSGRVSDPATLGFASVDFLWAVGFALVAWRLPATSMSTAQTAQEPQSGSGSSTSRYKRFLVLTRRTDRFTERVIAPHYAFLAELATRGVLADSGPFADGSGGAYVVRASSFGEAQTIAEADPLHVWGASQVTVHEWGDRRRNVPRSNEAHSSGIPS